VNKTQEVNIGSTEASRGTDEIAFLYAEHNPAHQTSRTRPSDHSDDDYDEEKGFERADGERQEGAQGEEEIEPREREEKFCGAHQEIISPATVVAGGHADQSAEEEGDSGAQETGEKRDLSAEKNAGELVAAVGVAAKQIDSGAFGAEEMQTEWYKTPQRVVPTAHKKVQWNDNRGVLFVLVERSFSQTKWIEKRARVEVVLRIHPMESHGRKIGVVAVLLDGIVGRKESCTGDDTMEHDQSDEPPGELLGPLHLALAAMRIRGSAQ
jgi:hypothetical protein